MPKSESTPKSTGPTFDSANLSNFGKMQADAFGEAQRELSNLFQQASEEWRSRAELEKELATELTSKLMSTKSLPEAATAYQEWMTRHIELMTKDTQKLFADSQKVMSAMSRFLPMTGKDSSK